MITWKVRNNNNTFSVKKEEQFANYFASVVLMPEEQLKDAISSSSNQKGEMTYQDLDSIARQFNVSLEALLWRICSVYKMRNDKIKKCISNYKKHTQLPLRESKTPSELPERYKNIASAALEKGLISSKQFANYLKINISDVYAYQMQGKCDVIKIHTNSF